MRLGTTSSPNPVFNSKMSNRRVKSLGYDDDDFYDDEEEDYENEEQELSPEDKEQMRLGTVQVRTALGPSFPATDHEIQEALWHYYYDVGKSVTYLKSEILDHNLK